MKINDKYEISPFGNTFDSLFSLLTRSNDSPVSTYQSSISEYGNVKISNEKKQVRIEFLVPGWKRNDLNLTIEGEILKLSTNSAKNKDQQHGLLHSKDLNIEVLLGDSLDTTKSNAKLENGILTILIPVSVKAKGRNIKIN